MLAIHKRLRSRALAYQRIFNGDDGKPNKDAEIVLADLKRFCYVDRPTVKISPTTQTMDPLATALAEGRREVALRVLGFLHLDEATIRSLTEPTQEDDHE
ncbi:Bbp19 family protein [Burkholderia gladioli]|uniref:Bbp19 family protein n=1 Tax=Burkholderia gladioli TaxID=28095 RepID=UPI0015E7144E|nr:hypothetical protein [Burkholderia gladioli]MBA1364051.1 hypothetical protein [Burkholderia gladioli]